MILACQMASWLVEDLEISLVSDSNQLEIPLDARILWTIHKISIKAQFTTLAIYSLVHAFVLLVAADTRENEKGKERMSYSARGEERRDKQ